MNGDQKRELKAIIEMAIAKACEVVADDAAPLAETMMDAAGEDAANRAVKMVAAATISKEAEAESFYMLAEMAESGELAKYAKERGISMPEAIAEIFDYVPSPQTVNPAVISVISRFLAVTLPEIVAHGFSLSPRFYQSVVGDWCASTSVRTANEFVATMRAKGFQLGEISRESVRLMVEMLEPDYPMSSSDFIDIMREVKDENGKQVFKFSQDHKATIIPVKIKIDGEKMEIEINSPNTAEVVREALEAGIVFRRGVRYMLRLEE